MSLTLEAMSPTLDYMPYIGDADGMHWAFGCTGSGIVMMSWLGHMVARKVVERPSGPIWPSTAASVRATRYISEAYGFCLPWAPGISSSTPSSGGIRPDDQPSPVGRMYQSAPNPIA